VTESFSTSGPKCAADNPGHGILEDVTVESRPTGLTRYPPPARLRDRALGWHSRLARPGWVLLPARLFLGGTFLFAGLQKLADPHFFDASRPTSIQGQLALFRHTSPIGALLGPAQSHAVAVGVLTAVAEIAVGLGTLLGFWARIAAVGGLLLSTSFFLTVSFHTRPYYYGSDIFVMVMWLPFIAVGAAGVLSVDGWVRQQAAADVGADADAPAGAVQPGFERRVLVLGGLVAAGVAAATGVLAGAGAGLGRLFGQGRSRHRSAAAPAPATSPTTAPGNASGTRVAAAADLPVGGAVRFTDPTTGQPAYVVQPTSGSYRGFSGICSHAGCTVNYASGDHRFVCPCHGSIFDGRTGDVLSGPAPRGLTPVPVRVANGAIEVPKA
jgi:thiosulfate dehydrogenase (quinone) large subunit